MILKILFIFYFCVASTLCRSTEGASEINIQLEEKSGSTSTHFSNHPPFNDFAREIPVAVVYDPLPVKSDATKENVRNFRARGVKRFGDPVVSKDQITATQYVPLIRLSKTTQSTTTITTMTTKKPTEVKKEKETRSKFALETTIETTNERTTTPSLSLRHLSDNLQSTTTTSTTTEKPIEVKKDTKNVDSSKSALDTTIYTTNQPATTPGLSSTRLSVKEKQSTKTTSTTTTEKPIEIKKERIILSKAEPPISTTNEKISSKSNNVDNFHIPVSIVIDDMIHKIKSLKTKQDIKPAVSTKENEQNINVAIIKNTEKPYTVRHPPSKEPKPTTAIPEKQTTTSSTTTETEEIKRKGKLIRQRDPVVPIIESENQIYAQTGKFKYSYEGGDGTKSFQSGVLKDFNDDRTGEAVVGGFSYKDDDGNDFKISYTADENGYRPVGAHLPTPPPVPPAIARALLYLATKTTPEPVTKSLSDED